MAKSVTKERILRPEVLVLLSGGLDSSACLQFYKQMGRQPCALFIDYDQAAAINEEQAAKAMADHFEVQLHIAQWRGVRSKSTGNITARNAFLLFAALMESPPEITTVAIGVHDGTEYTDCSATFIERIQSVYDLYTEGAVQVAAPFVSWNKSEVFAFAKANNLPVDLTYSCEAGGPSRCGKCLSCQDREALVRSA